MTDTIIEKDTIAVTIGDDHTYNCTAVTIGRTGENAISQLEITLPKALCAFQPYLEFKKPKGQTFRTERLHIEGDKIEYDIPSYLLDENGNLEVQLVLQNEDEKTWKSATKKYVVLKSIDAGENIPDTQKEDFFAEAQKTLDTVTTVSASAIKGKASGEVVALTDVSTLEHKIAVQLALPPETLSVTTDILDDDTDAVIGSADILLESDGINANAKITLKGFAIEDGKNQKGRIDLPSIPANLNPSEGGFLILSDESLTVWWNALLGPDRSYIYFQPNFEGAKTFDEVTFSHTYYPANLSAVTLKKYGKNLFDASKLLRYKWAVDENGVYSGTSGNLYYYFNRTSGVPYMTFEGVERLTLSFWGYFEEGQSPNGLYFQIKYEDGTAESFSVKSATDTYYTYTTKANAKPVALHFAYGNAGDMHYLRNIQIEVGTEATEYEPFNGCVAYTDINADGTVSGVTSLYPSTTLLTDTEGVTIEAEYNVDTKKYIDKKFAELASMIVSE